MASLASLIDGRQTVTFSRQARRQLAALEIDAGTALATLRQPEAVIRDGGRQVRAMRRLPVPPASARRGVMVVCRPEGPDRVQVQSVQVQGYNGPLPLWVHVLRLPIFIINRLMAARAN